MEVCAALCLIWLFFNFADTSSYVTQLSNDDIGILNCSSTEHNETVEITSADFNYSSVCNISNGFILQEVSKLCNNIESCPIQISDIIESDNTSCSSNETTGNLHIWYNCLRDGGWSEWSGYGTCSVTCGGGVQLRTRSCTNPAPSSPSHNCSGSDTDEMTCNKHNCSNPFTLMYVEGEKALLTCSVMYNETVEIASVNYNKSMCVHTDRYSLQNLCDGRNTCTVYVTNTNVGSSCGANGSATLQIMYNCIRNGGWLPWSSTSPCSVTCGSGIQTFTRNCSNPLPNNYGASCIGESSTEEICNSHNCVYEGKACIGRLVNWTCPGGYLQVKSATWKTTTTCGESFSSFKQHNVATRIRTTCNYRANCAFTAEDTSMGVSCSEPFSKCSGFEYVYTCITATWSGWTSWSTCSKSCGTGVQTRTRSCMNRFNTTDGCINDCEGVSEEDRKCKTEDCPYCGDQNFNDLDQTISNVETDVSSGTGYMLIDQINDINCCGRVKQWHIVPMKAGSITFIIWRKTSSSKYKVIGTNTITVRASDQGKETTYSLSESQMITTNKGDVIGWNDGGSNIIGYYRCISSTDMCPDSVLQTTQSSIKDGDKIDITSLDYQFNRTFGISYTPTNNRPPALGINTDSVTIGDHRLPDAWVMSIQLTQPDYGDFIKVIELDYDNNYFYFDTQSWGIYVKKELPHTIGVKQETHSYSLAVQDSCYNAVTINVTIVTENEPPLIKGLNHLLQINTVNLRSNLTSFRVVDPSDNVSCYISNTSPLTAMFLLSLDGSDASLHLSENASVDSNSSSQYYIHISCTDGTDSKTSNLTVLFTTMQETTVPDQTPIIIAASIGSVCFVIVILVILVCIWKWRHNLSVSKESDQYASMDEIKKEHLYEMLRRNTPKKD